MSLFDKLIVFIYIVTIIKYFNLFKIIIYVSTVQYILIYFVKKLKDKIDNHIYNFLYVYVYNFIYDL